MTVFFFDLILFIIEFWLHHVLLNLKFKLKFRISQFLLWILIHPLSTSLRPPPSRVASWVWKVHSRVGCRRLVYFLSLQDSKLSKGTCSLSHLLFSFLFFFFYFWLGISLSTVPSPLTHDIWISSTNQPPCHSLIPASLACRSRLEPTLPTSHLNLPLLQLPTCHSRLLHLLHLTIPRALDHPAVARPR